MGEPPGFKLFKLFDSRAQLNNLNNSNNLNNLNPGGGPRGGVRDPPRELNNLNPGGSPVFKLFKIFNSRPRASPPRPPPPGFKLFKLFKLFNSRPQLNNLNTGRPPDLNYLIPGVQTHWNTIWGLFGSWRVESCQHTHIQLPNRPGLSHTPPPPPPPPPLSPPNPKLRSPEEAEKRAETQAKLRLGVGGFGSDPRISSGALGTLGLRMQGFRGLGFRDVRA